MPASLCDAAEAPPYGWRMTLTLDRVRAPHGRDGQRVDAVTPFMIGVRWHWARVPMSLQLMPSRRPDESSLRLEVTMQGLLEHGR
eukprot:41318-Eustigmatos_ZCMA.PRE.1